MVLDLLRLFPGVGPGGLPGVGTNIVLKSEAGGFVDLLSKDKFGTSDTTT